MAERFCQECGSPNESDGKYCANCGSELRDNVFPAVPVTPSGPVTFVQSAAPGGTGVADPHAASLYSGQFLTQDEYAELERLKQVGRTRSGTLLLSLAFPIGRIVVFEVIGLAVAFLNRRIPVIELIGLILALIGTILVIRGRSAFGTRHSKFVVVSVIVYVVSLILAAIVIALFLKAIVDASVAGPRFLLPAFWPFVTAVIGTSALAGIAEILLVHELEGPFGRYVLYAALVATIAVPIGTILLLRSSFEGALAEIADGMITNPNDPRLVPLYNAGAILNLVAVIPSFLFSAAYLLVWRRIGRGEIPTSMSRRGPDTFPAEGAALQGAVHSTSVEPGLEDAPSEPGPPP